MLTLLKLFGCFLIVLHLFFQQHVFTAPYDFRYVEDRYDHSQWVLPMNKRSVSDEHIYQVAGKRIVSNNNFFSINPEAPPLAKYIYGLSIVYFNNPYYVSLIIWLGSIAAFYFLARSLLPSLYAHLAAIVFIAEPLLFSQSTATLLDLPQLLALLIHVTFMCSILNNNKKNPTLVYIGAGISLGAFISIKIGFIGLAILGLDALAVFLAKKSHKWIVIGVAAGCTYLLSYLPHLIHHPNIREFLGSQKWMVNFYFSSQPKFIPGMIFATMFTGWIKFWEKDSVWYREQLWTVFWPVYTGALFWSAYKIKQRIKSLSHAHIYLIVLGLGLSLNLAIIPFWPRYLVLLIPFAILITFQSLSKTRHIPKHSKIFASIIALICFFHVWLYSQASIQTSINTIKEPWQIGAYQDLYDWLDVGSKQKMSRSEFWRENLLFEEKLRVSGKTVEFIPTENTLFKDATKVNVKIAYATPLGNLTHSTTVLFKKEFNKWVLVWDNEHLLPDYTPTDAFSYDIQEGSFGTFSLSDGTIVSNGGRRPFFYVVPKDIKDEEALQKQLGKLTGLKKYHLEYRYAANNLPDHPAPIGFLNVNITNDAFEQMQLEPGINFEYITTRQYNQRLLKQGKLSKIYAIEHKNQFIHPIHGGVLNHIDKDGRVKRRLLIREAISGKPLIREKL